MRAHHTGAEVLQSLFHLCSHRFSPLINLISPDLGGEDMISPNVSHSEYHITLSAFIPPPHLGSEEEFIARHTRVLDAQPYFLFIAVKLHGGKHRCNQFVTVPHSTCMYVRARTWAQSRNR